MPTDRYDPPGRPIPGPDPEAMVTTDLSAEQLERRILLDAAELIALDKPWGIPSTGLTLDDPDSLQFHLMQREGGMVWAVHQLDADTSGINVFVRRRDAVRRWQLRIRHPVAAKSYLAVVHGEMEADRLIDAPIGVVRTEPSPCLGIAEGGRSARSHLQVIDRNRGFSLLRVRIETGRTHQIRIHCSSVGHPLVGEKWYRDERCELHPRQALHAVELRFFDGGEPERLTCPPPEDLLELMERLGLRATPRW